MTVMHRLNNRLPYSTALAMRGKLEASSVYYFESSWDEDGRHISFLV
jgi:hypothetical protein